MPRIGLLVPGSPAAVLIPTEAFQQGLRELGYVEGQNVAIESRFAGEQLHRLPALAAELVQLPADLIVAFGPHASAAAKQATPAIPIVMAAAIDPIGTGLIASLARPGGNITGTAVVLDEARSCSLTLV